MPWIRRNQLNEIAGSAISPPIDEATQLPVAGWVEIAEDDPEYLDWLNQPIPSPLDWAGLLNRLRGTVIFGKALTGNPNYFSVLNSALTSTRNLQDFEWALGAIRPTMTADFDAAEIAQINTWLEECNFETRIS